MLERDACIGRVFSRAKSEKEVHILEDATSYICTQYEAKRFKDDRSLNLGLTTINPIT